MTAWFGRRWTSGIAMVGVAALLLACAGWQPGLAQEGKDPSVSQSLRHGSLVVWVIGSARPTQRTVISNYAINPPSVTPYKEQTAGSFGQDASTFGQTAGSVGIPTDSPSIATQHSVGGNDAPPPAVDGSGYHEQTSGSFGQSSSSVGTNAGDHGQTAGSFGTAASNSGTNAGNYGQTAGSFGTSLSDIDKSSGAKPQEPASLQPDRAEINFGQALGRAFPNLQVKFVMVDGGQLKAQLVAAQGTAEAPDMLLGTLPDGLGAEVRHRFLLETVQFSSTNDSARRGAAEREPAEHEETSSERTAATVLATIVAAPHPETARAVLRWLRDSRRGQTGR